MWPIQPTARRRPPKACCLAKSRLMRTRLAQPSTCKARANSAMKFAVVRGTRHRPVSPGLGTTVPSSSREKRVALESQSVENQSEVKHENGPDKNGVYLN